MTVFVDTSAFIAILNKDDEHHSEAKDLWINLISSDTVLVSNNYVVLESFAVMQRKLGMESARVFQEDILPLINIEWINDSIHEAGISAFLTASRKNLSLVDCISFEIMRRHSIKTAFAFDPHFGEQGFICIPQNSGQKFGD